MDLDSWDHETDGCLPDHLEVWTTDAVVCPACRYRWRAVRSLSTPVDVLECPLCGRQGTELSGEHNVAELTMQ